MYINRSIYNREIFQIINSLQGSRFYRVLYHLIFFYINFVVVSLIFNKSKINLFSRLFAKDNPLHLLWIFGKVNDKLDKLRLLNRLDNLFWLIKRFIFKFNFKVIIDLSMIIFMNIMSFSTDYTFLLLCLNIFKLIWMYLSNFKHN